MKKDICEYNGCRKTATRRLRNGHMVCEDCYKTIRRRIRGGEKVAGFFKEKLIGHIGPFALYADLFVKL